MPRRHCTTFFSYQSYDVSELVVFCMLSVFHMLYLAFGSCFYWERIFLTYSTWFHHGVCISDRDWSSLLFTHTPKTSFVCIFCLLWFVSSVLNRHFSILWIPNQLHFQSPLRRTYQINNAWTRAHRIQNDSIHLLLRSQFLSNIHQPRKLHLFLRNRSICATWLRGRKNFHPAIALSLLMITSRCLNPSLTRVLPLLRTRSHSFSPDFFFFGKILSIVSISHELSFFLFQL